MKQWYKQLKIEYKISLWSLIVLATLFIATIPCFFFGYMEIPQGIALGGSIGIITYLLLGIFNNKDQQKKSLTFTLIIIIVRLLVIGGILFLVSWLYYVKGLKAFNVFAVAGSYLVSIIVNFVIFRKEKQIGNPEELS